MMKEEFEKLVESRVSPDDYQLIEKVYTYHPAEFSKEAIAALYGMGGLSLISDLEAAVDSMQHLERQMNSLKKRLAEFEKKKEALKSTYKAGAPKHEDEDEDEEDDEPDPWDR